MELNVELESLKMDAGNSHSVAGNSLFGEVSHLTGPENNPFPLSPSLYPFYSPLPPFPPFPLTLSPLPSLSPLSSLPPSLSPSLPPPLPPSPPPSLPPSLPSS